MNPISVVRFSARHEIVKPAECEIFGYDVARPGKRISSAKTRNKALLLALIDCANLVGPVPPDVHVGVVRHERVGKGCGCFEETVDGRLADDIVGCILSGDVQDFGVPQNHCARGAVAIYGLGVGLDALDYGIVVATGLAFFQVVVRVLLAFEEGLPLLAPDPAVAAGPYREAAGVGREVVDVSRYLQPVASVAGSVGMGAAIFWTGRRTVGKRAIKAARPLSG